MGPTGLLNTKDIGHRITESTGEKKSTSYLMQTIGMAKYSAVTAGVF